MDCLYLHDSLVKQVSPRSGLGHVIKGYKPILVLIKAIQCVCFSLMILIKQKALKILKHGFKSIPELEINDKTYLIQQKVFVHYKCNIHVHVFVIELYVHVTLNKTD